MIDEMTPRIEVMVKVKYGSGASAGHGSVSHAWEIILRRDRRTRPHSQATPRRAKHHE